MASIITATTTSGLTQSADNSGVLQLASGAGNLVTVPSGTGTAVVNGINSSIVSGTAVASTSGTSIDFTSIPSWVKRITVMFNGVSWNNTVNPLIQLGDSGGVETTGYSCIAGNSSSTSGTSATAETTGFGFQAGWSADSLFSGSVIFSLLNASTNTWVGQGTFYGDSSTTDYVVSIAGVKSLSATLDRVRITSSAAITFDAAGSINILYE
jgi:hypothetical protein